MKSTALAALTLALQNGSALAGAGLSILASASYQPLSDIEMDAVRGSAAYLQVNRVDDELIVSLNGRQIYDIKLNDNIILSRKLDLTPLLKPGTNQLQLVGINVAGPAAFSGTLDLGSGSASTFSFAQNPAPAGRVWSQTLTFTQ